MTTGLVPWGGGSFGLKDKGMLSVVGLWRWFRKHHGFKAQHSMKGPVIYVTKPMLPNFYKFIWQLRGIWSSKVLTNGGPISKKLQYSLEQWLGVEDLTLVCNGTCALDVALNAINLQNRSDVITTPFSFVASSNAIIRKGLKPVFVDVDRDSYNISPTLVEKAITNETAAILGVHVYGVPCKVQELEVIGKRYNIPVIYDGAHAFGVRLGEKTLLRFGDLSTCSFHATKVFNTGEGGCVIRNNDSFDDIQRGINFGFCSENDISEFGINAKMSEFAAALGVVNLKTISATIQKRAMVYAWYDKYLNGQLIPDTIKHANDSQDITWNYSYMPIRLCSQEGASIRDRIYESLKQEQIYSRKYFYPLIPETTAYKANPSAWMQKGSLEHARQATLQTLCLPIYPGLSERDVKRIASIVNEQASFVGQYG